MMKKLLFTILFIAANLALNAQVKLIDQMQENVRVEQDDQITALLLDKQEGTHRQKVQIQGYRVQVYSSNNGQHAKTEAFKVEKKILESDLDVETYVVYTTPFWKVRLGNFRTQEEALLLKEEIIQRFPQMQGDTYIVRDKIDALQ